MSVVKSKALDLSADVVIVGFGAAGAAAALTVARLGGRALLLEKQPEGRHVSSVRMSGGLIMATGDVDAATAYLDRCSGGMTPHDVSRAWAERAATVAGWLEGIGVATEPIAAGWHPVFPGCDAMTVLAIPADDAPVRRRRSTAADVMAGVLPSRSGYRGGFHLADALEAAVSRESAVSVRYGARAQKLVLGPTGRVVGVQASVDGSSRTFDARKGVILTTGGFGYDEQMKLNHLKAYPIYFYGSSANTGDGIRMAQQAGADLWHMNQMVGRAVFHVELDGEELNFQPNLSPPGYLIVDRHGRRYANEYMQAVNKPHFYHEMLAYDAQMMEYPRIPSYWLLDSRRIAAGPLVHTSAGLVRVGRYDWSEDNGKERALGWISEGSSIEEVAEQAGIEDRAAAAATVAEYNRRCRAGDDRFGRPRESLLPLDNPPFFCMKLYPGGANTCGGPTRDAKARVLDPWRTPIPGLFAAGELGEVVGQLYPAAGANLSDALCFGQIAVESALRA